MNMVYDEKVLIEALETLGITLWVEGMPFGKVRNGDLVGGCKCSSCEQYFTMGVTIGAAINVCRGCLDSLRQLLFRLIREQFPDIDKEERPGAKEEDEVE